MDIPIRTNLTLYTKQVVTLLSFFYQLTEKEQEVLSKLLLVYLKNIDHPKKEELTFAPQTLKLIRSNLKLGLQAFNNYKMQLRYKKVLTFSEDKKNTLFSPTLKKILPKNSQELKNYSLNFKFQLDEPNTNS